MSARKKWWGFNGEEWVPVKELGRDCSPECVRESPEYHRFSIEKPRGIP